jgi:hypothetical protein
MKRLLKLVPLAALGSFALLVAGGAPILRH